MRMEWSYTHWKAQLAFMHGGTLHSLLLWIVQQGDVEGAGVALCEQG